ncbi:MAG: YtxH domain-containing protein [Bryobacteraceae bacterium]
MADEDRGGNVVWFVAGVAVGAAVALLYAPKSGNETRRYLVEKGESGRESLSEAGKELYDRGREIYSKSRQMADEAADLFERGKKLVKG